MPDPLGKKTGSPIPLCGLSFFLSPLSFYQVNREQAERFTALLGICWPRAGDTVLDLYCGTGTIDDHGFQSQKR